MNTWLRSNTNIFAWSANGVVLLDFDTATQAANGVYNFNSFYAQAGITPLRTYTTSDRQAVLAAIQQDYAPFVQAGVIYFTLDPHDPKLLATNGNFITEYFNQSVPLSGDEPTSPIQVDNQPNVQFQPGGTSNDLDFRDADMTGQALVAFVTLKGDRTPSKELNQELLDHVAKEIGKFARPKSIRFADAVPKTRSGKIMRRLLREIATNGEVKGDTTTLEDLSVLTKLSAEED